MGVQERERERERDGGRERERERGKGGEREIGGEEGSGDGIEKRATQARDGLTRVAGAGAGDSAGQGHAGEGGTG